MRLEGNVVQSDGVVTGSDAHIGRFRDLLELEKQFVLGIVQRLGYVMSEAERQLILENGTRNLVAFLAYSRGLEAEELGDYNLAALHFGQAVQADPSFGEARTRHEANAAAPEVQGASAAEVTQVASTSVVDPTATPVPMTEALVAAISDVAPTIGEQTTQSTTTTTAQQAVEHVATTAGNTVASSPPPPDVAPPLGTPPAIIIRIVFRIP